MICAGGARAKWIVRWMVCYALVQGFVRGFLAAGVVLVLPS